MSLVVQHWALHGGYGGFRVNLDFGIFFPWEDAVEGKISAEKRCLHLHGQTSENAAAT